MAPRLELHNLLKTASGLSNVYFSPPPNFKMNYPCIVYRRENADTRFAANKPYRTKFRYELTLIHADPDNNVVAKLLALPSCVHTRFFVNEQLNHDVFNIFF